MPEEISEFIGASIICFPALLALSWVIFLVIQRFDFPRPAAVIASCVLALAMSVGLRIPGRNSLEMPVNINYELINAVLAAIIGGQAWR